MNRANISIIIYLVLLGIIVFLNLLPQLKPYTAIKNVQLAGLITSSLLLIIIFYFIKNFISNGDNSYIITLCIFYTIWYYATKLTTNKITSQHNILNDIF